MPTLAMADAEPAATEPAATEPAATEPAATAAPAAAATPTAHESAVAAWKKCYNDNGHDKAATKHCAEL